MKNNLKGTPCWVLSSHGHPCEAETASALAFTAPARPAAIPRPRRLSRRTAQLATYWMQAAPALPERPSRKRPTISLG